MLDDRPYMRPGEPNFGSSPLKQPWAGWAILLTINVVVFILQVLVDSNSLAQSSRFANSIVAKYLALDTSNITWMLPLQIVTFQFLHGGVMHLLMNGLGLFFIGRALEPAIGRREIVALYLVSGLAGGLFQLLFAFVFPDQFAGPMVGASAGVFGFMGVLARLFPQREVYLLLFFVLPLRLKLNWIFWGSFAIAVLSIAVAIQTAAGAQVAHAAHLGGLLYGAFFVAALMRRGGFLSLFSKIPKVRIVPDAAAPGKGAAKRRDWRRPKVVDAAEVSGEDFISQEVDPILDKISKQGIHSLTERERKILEKARSKM